jgi:hypothetical protein
LYAVFIAFSLHSDIFDVRNVMFRECTESFLQLLAGWIESTVGLPLISVAQPKLHLMKAQREVEQEGQSF